MTGKPTQSPLTILHIFSGDQWAGAEVMVYSLLTRLRAYPDFQCMALSLNAGVLTEKLIKCGIEMHVLPEGRLSFGQLLVRASRLFRHQRVDVIHSHGYKQNLLALILARSLGVPSLIATLHGLSEPLHGATAKRQLIKWLDRWILRNHFTRVVAVSHEMRSCLSALGDLPEEKLVVIHNGIEIDRRLETGCRPASERGTGAPFHIGTVGRLVPVKDFGLFLAIAAEIRKEIPDVRFSILGDGPLREQLERQADDLGLTNCVEFLGHATDPWSYYASLDLYLNTSLHEGIPMTVLEAMACGVPVVAAAVGGLPEIVTDGRDGFLVSERDARRYAHCCLQLLRDWGRSCRMAQQARDRVEEYFSAARMSQEYRALYLSHASYSSPSPSPRSTRAIPTPLHGVGSASNRKV
jgi:glycosyltransferase involved in cell wall biosynthesis